MADMSNVVGALITSGVALLFAAIALGAALLMPGGNEVTPPRSIVTMECVGTECMSPEEIESLVGFTPLEPQSLPDGYVLYGRYVLEDEIPLQARERIAEARGVPLSEVPMFAPPTTVHLEYRFEGRAFVPLITLIETKVDDAAVLSMPSPDCGEEIQMGDRLVIYGEGAGSVVQEDPTRWHACPSHGGTGAIGNAVFLEDGVLVEVKVPLEHLSRDEVLGIVRSM